MSESAQQQSPKTRGPQPRLRREQVVRVALELLDEVGLDGLSLRRLADKLHVQAPALYWHFKNKQELLNQMAETMIMSPYEDDINRQREERLKGIDWQKFLINMGVQIRKVMLQHRDGARLVVSTTLVSERMIGGLDFTVGVLVAAGFSHRKALLATFTVINYALGFTFEEQNRPRNSQTAVEMRKAIAENNFEHLMGAFMEFEKELTPDEEYMASLHLIIDGLAAQAKK
jgi:TetR/AcrR family tetracycline transcriptional repressor